MEKLAFSITTI